jgi:peptidyl-prolyl cis-trans isomerase C
LFFIYSKGILKFIAIYSATLINRGASKMARQRLSSVLVGSVFLLMSLQGCDQISTLKEYILSYKKTVTAKKDTPAASSAKFRNLSSPSTGSSAKKRQGAPDVLARVGSWTLTVGEFKERLVALKEIIPGYVPGNVEQDKMILQELINQQLLVAEAERLKIGEKKDIKEAVEEFRRTLLVQELARGLIEKIDVTDEEVKNFYEINKAEFVEPAQWSVREIVVDTEEEAKELLIDLYRGADFGETAKLRSKGQTAEQGGSLGEMSVFDFPKQGDIVTALEAGDISRAFKGPEGFYIVKLEDKKGGEQQELAKIKEDIKAGLIMRKQQEAVVNYLSRLEGKAEIDINEKLLEE